MAGVFRDVTVEWKGQDYVITPSTRLLARIESRHEISITRMMFDIQRGHPPGFVMACVLADLLNSAGAKTSEDEVAQVLNGGDAKAVASLAVSLSTMLTPQQLKKSDAPGDQGAPTKTRKRSTGRRST